jgi:integral membrane protein (TIGR01906 family)
LQAAVYLALDMRRATLLAVTVLVAVLVPPFLATTALRLVADDWVVSFAYEHGGVPPDRYGLTTDERTDLALVGLDSILPGSTGVVLLEQARLPDGSRAFDRREVTHMQDVRDAVGIAFAVQVGTALTLLAATVALAWSRATRRPLLRGWQAGAIATLGVAMALGLFMLLAWDRFFVDFHGVFFEGDSWRFSRTDTLLRLYPDELWTTVAAWIAGIAVALALAALAAATLLLRRAR